MLRSFQLGQFCLLFSLFVAFARLVPIILSRHYVWWYSLHSIFIIVFPITCCAVQLMFIGKIIIEVLCMKSEIWNQYFRLDRSLWKQQGCLLPSFHFINWENKIRLTASNQFICPDKIYVFWKLGVRQLACSHVRKNSQCFSILWYR